MNNKTVVKSCDILVIGGGVAGCVAAIRARKLGADVILACKATTGASGASAIVDVNVHSYLPGEELDAYLRESLSFQDFLTDQNLSVRIIKENPHCLDLLRSWGVKFVKMRGKEIRTSTDRVFKHPSLWVEGGGLGAMRALAAEARRSRVRIVDRVMITDLLVSASEGRIIGAVGFGVRDGNFYLFQAKAVVLASGRWTIASPMTSPGPGDTTGDGQAMAFRVGAELQDIEQITYLPGPTGALVPQVCHWILGGKVVDGHGNDVLSGQQKHGATYYQFMTGHQRAIKEGAGAYDSHEDMSVEQAEVLRRAAPRYMAGIRLLGYSFPHDKVSLTIGLGRTYGGVKGGDDMETSIPGLFAAGDASEMKTVVIQGWPACAGIALIAGEAAFNFSSSVSSLEAPSFQVEPLKSKIYQPLTREQGISPREVRNKVWDIFHKEIGWIRHEKRLLKAIELLEQIKEEDLPRLKANDYHELMKANEMVNIVEVVDLCARTSLVRKESRLFAQREDYPNRDDVTPMWTRTKLENGKLKIWTVPIPMPKFTPKEVYDVD